MPTVMTHAAVPLGIGLGLGERVVSRRLLVAGVVAAMLPDVDTVGFRFGVAYGSELGHRGFTHSLVFAMGLGAIGALCHRFLRATGWAAFVFLFVSGASHGLLDLLTTGGRGVALLWPFSHARYFARVRVIQVAPIGVGRFLGHSEGGVMMSELVWVWLPALGVLLSLAAYRRRRLALRG